MTDIYHITHIENLPSIISTEGLVCDSRKQDLLSIPASIAFEDIKEKRSRKLVPCGPKGCVSDYVPFYFAPRSPMLYTISKGNIPERRESDIIYLVSSIEKMNTYSLGYVFCDGHPIMAFTSFFDKLDDLDKVDWQLMNSKYWHDISTDLDRKRRRQAEFLVYDFFPWNLVEEIVVINEVMERRVNDCMNGLLKSPSVSIKREWYYG